MSLQFIIGECLNQISSKDQRVGKAVQERDEETIRQITERQTKQLRELVSESSLTGKVPAYLDVHLLLVAKPGSTLETVSWFIGTVQKYTTLPLSIDSDSLDLLMMGLKEYDYDRANGMPPLLNAIRQTDSEFEEKTRVLLELKEEKHFRIVLACAQRFDEQKQGLTKSSAEKLEVAKYLIGMARSYSFADEDIIIDPGLTGFSVCLRSTNECLKAIRDLKQDAGYENINTTLGLSQLTFQNPKRIKSVLKSYLVELEKAGISSVIMNPGDYNAKVNEKSNDFVNQLLKVPCKNQPCNGNAFDTFATCFDLGFYGRIQQVYRALNN